MSKNNTMIFEEMRPPVAAHHGETPLRGKNVNRLIELANGEFADGNGYRINKEQVVKNYTDDARLKDANWNARHHVTPSHFNSSNHKYYKVSCLVSTESRLTNHLHIYSNTSTKTSRTSRAFCCIHSANLTPTKRTM